MTETSLGAALAGDLGVFGQEFGATSDQPGTAPANSRDFMKEIFGSVSVLQGLEHSSRRAMVSA